MKLKLAPFRLLGAVALAALGATGIAAQPWEQVAQLPGGIALELDRGSVSQEMDGDRQVAMGVFRKQLPNALMETSVAVDCALGEAKIRRVRLIDGSRVMTDNILAAAEFAPINEGSAEAFYQAALCSGEESAEG
jgi:hypothetical protein